MTTRGDLLNDCIYALAACSKQIDEIGRPLKRASWNTEEGCEADLIYWLSQSREWGRRLAELVQAFDHTIAAVQQSIPEFVEGDE